MTERHDFKDAYLGILAVSIELQEGSCSLEDYTVATKEYGIKVCDLLDSMVVMLHQIDNRLDGIEARLDRLEKK